MLTVLQHVNLMKHALGGAPDSRHDLYQTFNRAGRYLYNYFPWSWRLKNATLVPVAASEDVPLPSDFEQVESAYIPGSATSLQLVDLAVIHAARANTAMITSGWLICIPPYTVMGDTGLTSRNAILYPVPTTNAVPAIDLWYRCAWHEYASTGDDAKIPRIPPEFEEALILLARDGAISLDDQMASFEGSRAGAMLEKLKSVDASRQGDLGPMRGGARDRMAWNRRLRGSIVNPSVTI